MGKEVVNTPKRINQSTECAVHNESASQVMKLHLIVWSPKFPLLTGKSPRESHYMDKDNRLPFTCGKLNIENKYHPNLRLSGYN